MVNRVASTPSPLRADVRHDAFLKDVVTLIVTRYQPSRMFLFGSRARGDFKSDSDYDFLIEVAELPKDDRFGDRRMFFLNDLGHRDVQIHVRLPGELEDQSSDPGTIDWDVAREGVLLHSFEEMPSRTAPRTVVREKKRDRFASVDQWLRLARQDLAAAEQLSTAVESFAEMICFHCQQSAEKYLKALIINRGIRPERTHDVRRLLEQAQTLGFDYSGLFNDGEYLTPFAVEFRYPPTHVVDEERALAAARRITAAVNETLTLG